MGFTPARPSSPCSSGNGTTSCTHLCVMYTPCGTTRERDTSKRNGKRNGKRARVEPNSYVQVAGMLPGVAGVCCRGPSSGGR
jgi:hypothetical protein